MKITFTDEQVAEIVYSYIGTDQENMSLIFEEEPHDLSGMYSKKDLFEYIADAPVGGIISSNMRDACISKIGFNEWRIAV